MLTAIEILEKYMKDDNPAESIGKFFEDTENEHTNQIEEYQRAYVIASKILYSGSRKGYETGQRHLIDDMNERYKKV